jgi:hypothetical protein
MSSTMRTFTMGRTNRKSTSRPKSGTCSEEDLPPMEFQEMPLIAVEGQW